MHSRSSSATSVHPLAYPRAVPAKKARRRQHTRPRVSSDGYCGAAQEKRHKSAAACAATLTRACACDGSADEARKHAAARPAKIPAGLQDHRQQQ